MGSPSPSRISTWHILGYTGQRKVEEKQKAQSTYPEKGSSSIFFIITTSLTNHKQALDIPDANGNTDRHQILDCILITTRKSSDVAQAMNTAHAEARPRVAAAWTK